STAAPPRATTGRTFTASCCSTSRVSACSRRCCSSRLCLSRTPRWASTRARSRSRSASARGSSVAYFTDRWPVPTDFVGADLADSLYWNHAAKLGDEDPRLAPPLDLPGTVVDMEKSSMFGPTGITAILLSAGTDGADDADHWASVHYPSHGTAIKLPAGVGPAWLLDDLVIGKTYTFSVSAMVDITNPGSEPIPDVRLEVLDTSQASDYAALPEVVLGDEYTPYALEFVAEATTHYVALTTETAWET